MLLSFGVQKAFEGACQLGEDELLRMMITSVEKNTFFISHDLLREVIRLKLTKVLLALLDCSGVLELRGEHTDPDGACLALLKQDQYDEPFELPTPAQHYTVDWKR